MGKEEQDYRHWPRGSSSHHDLPVGVIELRISDRRNRSGLGGGAYWSIFLDQRTLVYL